jgi:hypothetical protein
MTNDERRTTTTTEDQMIAELREIAATLSDYSDSLNSAALYELSKRVEAIADAMEAEGAAAAAYVAERDGEGR